MFPKCQNLIDTSKLLEKCVKKKQHIARLEFAQNRAECMWVFFVSVSMHIKRTQKQGQSYFTHVVDTTDPMSHPVWLS